jgi:hypothetical protein
MKHRHNGLASFASALATTFNLFPATDYRTVYFRKSASDRMDEAWARTGKEMGLAFHKVTLKNAKSR